MANRRGDNWLEAEAERVSERRALVRAAHEANGPFIRDLRPWDCTLTGTYSPSCRGGHSEVVLGVKVHTRVSRWKALRDCHKLLQFASELVGAPVAGVLSVEPHMDCSYHLHGVLDLLGASRAYLNALRWWWQEHYGWCEFNAPRSRGAVSSYVGKHLTGPMADVLFSAGYEWSVIEDPDKGCQWVPRELPVVRLVAGGTLDSRLDSPMPILD